MRFPNHANIVPNKLEGLNGLRQRVAQLGIPAMVALGSNACMAGVYAETSLTTGGNMGLHEKSDTNDQSNEQSNDAEVRTTRIGIDGISSNGRIRGGVAFELQSLAAERVRVIESGDGLEVEEKTKFPDLGTLVSPSAKFAYTFSPHKPLSAELQGNFTPTFMGRDLNGARADALLGIRYRVPLMDNDALAANFKASLGGTYLSHSFPLETGNGSSVDGVGFTLAVSAGADFDLASLITSLTDDESEDDSNESSGSVGASADENSFE